MNIKVDTSNKETDTDETVYDNDINEIHLRTKAHLDPNTKLWTIQQDKSKLESKNPEKCGKVTEKEGNLLTLEDLLQALQETRPSVSKTELQKFKRIYEKFTGGTDSPSESERTEVKTQIKIFSDNNAATGSRQTLA